MKNTASNGDVAYLVIEAMNFNQDPMSLKEILDEVPFSKASVAGTLAILNAIGLVEKKAKGDAPDSVEHTLSTQITPYQIIKVVELGVDLRDLSKLLGITDKQKQAALTLATQADKLKELDDQLRAKRSAERAKPVDALPRDTIVDTLERLAMASKMSMEDFKREGGREPEVLLALQEAHDQALKALQEYQEELSKAGSHSGF